MLFSQIEGEVNLISSKVADRSQNYNYLQFKFIMIQPRVYSFSFQYQLFGNNSDFYDVYQTVARDFRFIHWFNENNKIQSLRNFVVGKRKDKSYDLLKHESRDLEQELKIAREIKNHSNKRITKKEDQEEQREARKLLFRTQTELPQVIKILNKHYHDSLNNDHMPDFLVIQQLRISLSKEEFKARVANSQKPERQKLKPFYSVLVRRPKQNFKEKTSQNIQLQYVIISLTQQKCYEFDITLTSKIKDLSPEIKEIYKFQRKEIGVKVLSIKFQVQDKESFFESVLEIKENPFHNITHTSDDFFPSGKLKLPFREDLKIRKKQFDTENYSLAFQGGGAKGLAYVGAYKALKENQTEYYQHGQKKKKSVPISSIMGSSAGGMIALAVSTGISHRQLQKICFKMKDIPKNDSFRKESQTNKEENKVGEEQKDPTQEQVFESIKNILKQYGILTYQGFQYVKSTIKQLVSKGIMKPLLNQLSLIMPSIGDILRNQDGNLNLQGFLIKGALMKGDAVHDIGVQCLIKYFLKIYYENTTDELKILLNDCFSVYRSQDINYKGFIDYDISDQLMKILKQYHSLAKDILNMPIKSIKIYKNSCQFFVSVINALILLMVDNQEYHQKHKKQKRNNDIMKQIYQSFKWNTLKKVFSFKQSSLKNADTALLLQKHTQQTSLWDLLFPIQEQKCFSCSDPNYNSCKNLQLKKTRTNLLDISFFDQSKQDCDLTIKQFIQQLLGQRYKHYFQDICYFEHAETQFQLEGTKVPKFELQLAQIIVEAFEFFKTKEKQLNLPQEIINFGNKKADFAACVKDITMMEYYMLTNVELTCTSVDLDDKILRLFNKKTAPFLPVCKAVQMSGSFPGAFKAQKWKKEWGSYSIYYKTYRAEINLVGHEFTDGGLLANFPIRYLNNRDLCKKYLSHIPNNETIMLGFGLDCLTAGNYQPNMKEIYEAQNQAEKIKKGSQELTWEKLKQSLSLFKLGKDYFYNVCSNLMKKEQAEQIDWTDINHAVLQEVPIIRFLLKLLDAYPNSDRNFNIQTFSNRVLHQNIYQKWKTKYQVYERESTQINLSFVKLKNILNRMKKNEYKPTLNMKEKPQKEYADPRAQFEEVILKKCREREKEIQERIQIKKKLLTHILNNKDNLLIKQDPWIKKHINQLPREMTKKLIIILMMLVKQAPTKTRRDLALQFLSLKYPDCQKIDNPLEYDIGGSLKRIVQYLFLKLTKSQSQKETQSAQNKVKYDSYEEILDLLNEQSHQNQAVTTKFPQFNYQSVKTQFKSIIRKIINDMKKGQTQQMWNQHFTNFIEEIIKDGNMVNYNASLYCKQSFKQNFFVKSQNPINRKEYQTFVQKTKEKGSKQYLQYMQSQLFQFFRDNSQPSHLKNNYVYEAENIYSQNLQDINKILLKQLSCRAIQFMNHIKQNEGLEYEEVKQLFSEKYKYSLLKLVRAVTYYCDQVQQNGRERFTMKQRKEIEHAILTIFFGRNRKRYRGFQQYLKDVDQRTKNQYNQYIKVFEQQLLKQNSNLGNHQTLLQCYFLRVLERMVLTFVIANKIALINRQEQKYVADDAREMLRKFNHFTEDFKFITGCLKEVNVILSYLSSNLQTSKNQIKYDGQKSPRVEKAAKIKFNYHYKDILNLNQNILYLIVEDFIEQTSVLSVKPNNTISMTSLQQTFMIRFQLVKYIINKIYLPLKYRSLQLQLDNRNKDNCQEFKCIHYILSIFDKLTYHKFSIPLFEIDWKLTLKAEVILKIQQNKVIPIQSSFAQQIKFIVVHQRDGGKFMPQKQKEVSPLHIHLILQGVSSSNQYYCTMLSLARDCYRRTFSNPTRLNTELSAIATQHTLEHVQSDIYDLEEEFNANDPNLQMITAVTCSNFHVMFGFLLSTNTTLDKVKKELYHLKRISQEFQTQKRIQDYFSSYQWLNQCTNQYKQLLTYLEKERSQFFQQFQNLKQRNFNDDSLKSEYEYMKSYFKNETKTFVANYDRILQEITKQVQIVDDKYKPVNKPQQICKRFAFDYIEQFQGKISEGKYSKINQEVFDKLKSIVHAIYGTFGTLIEGIFCSIVSQFGAITINDANAKYITKGIVIKKLLSTFQLKEYIVKKLKSLHLSPSISLSKFYDSAPRPIFLNLCAINMNQERLQFLNKTTMPFMPVWAAILASTSLPFLYNYFSARQEWYGVQQRSTFYSLIVQKFFKVDDSIKPTVNYCSSNYISSLPLQIMTNKPVLKKLGSKYNKDTKAQNKGENNKSKFQNLTQIALAFSDKYQDDFRSLKVKRKYVTCKSLMPLFSKFAWGFIKNKLFSLGKKEIQDKPGYWGNYLAAISKIGNLANTFSTLVNSNDNFVLQWYFDKLIKLPIKLGTLDFHLIVDKDCYQKHGIKVLSQRAKQTVQRSYEITKSFTGYLTQQFKQRQTQRYKIKLRFEMIYKTKHQEFIYRYAKLNILNHSKWNQNRFNNFNVYYRVMNIRSFTKEFKKATESEIIWNIEIGNKIQIKFYFPQYPLHVPNKAKNIESIVSYGDNKPHLASLQQSAQHQRRISQRDQQEQLAKVHYTAWVLDFKDIFDKMYCDKSTVQPADNFQFQLNYLNGHKDYTPGKQFLEITPILKKNNIFYKDFYNPQIFAQNLSYNDQKQYQEKKLQTSLPGQKQRLASLHLERKKNSTSTSHIEELNKTRVKDSKTDSVYISEWVYLV